VTRRRPDTSKRPLAKGILELNRSSAKNNPPSIFIASPTPSPPHISMTSTIKVYLNETYELKAVSSWITIEIKDSNEEYSAHAFPMTAMQ